jgi:hypothetical protein
VILIAVLGAGLTVGLSTFAGGQLAVRQDYGQIQKLQAAITRIDYEIKNGSGVSVAGNVVSYTLTSSKSIYAKGTQLILLSGGAEHVLTDNISNFTASYANSLLNISFTTTLANGASTQTTLYIHA